MKNVEQKTFVCEECGDELGRIDIEGERPQQLFCRKCSTTNCSTTKEIYNIAKKIKAYHQFIDMRDICSIVSSTLQTISSDELRDELKKMGYVKVREVKIESFIEDTLGEVSVEYGDGKDRLKIGDTIYLPVEEGK